MTSSKSAWVTQEMMFIKKANAEGDRSREKSTHSGARRRKAGPNRQQRPNGLYLSPWADRAGFDQAPGLGGGRQCQCFISMVVGSPHCDQTNRHCQRANAIRHGMQCAKEQQGSDRKSCGRTHRTLHYTAALDFSWGFFGMSDTFEAEPSCHA